MEPTARRARGAGKTCKRSRRTCGAMNDGGRSPGAGRPPPAPWHCRVDAVVWWHRAAPAVAAALPGALRAAPRMPLTVAALVRYADTPVGPYEELAACPMLFLDGLRVAGHVPFIAVDSAASAEAGRALWALPKRLAAFTRPAAAGRADAMARGGDGSWTVEVRTSRSRARIPFVAAGRCVQVDEHGARLAFPVVGAGLA